MDGPRPIGPRRDIATGPCGPPTRLGTFCLTREVPTTQEGDPWLDQTPSDPIAIMIYQELFLGTEFLEEARVATIEFRAA